MAKSAIPATSGGPKSSLKASIKPLVSTAQRGPSSMPSSRRQQVQSSTSAASDQRKYTAQQIEPTIQTRNRPTFHLARAYPCLMSDVEMARPPNSDTSRLNRGSSLMSVALFLIAVWPMRTSRIRFFGSRCFLPSSASSCVSRSSICSTTPSSADQLDWSQLLTSKTADAVGSILGSIFSKAASSFAALSGYFSFAALSSPHWTVGREKRQAAKCVKRD